jgi:PilZ domain
MGHLLEVSGEPRVRRWPRMRLNVPIRIWNDDEQPVEAQAGEISEGGLTVLCRNHLRVDEVITIEFGRPLATEPVRITGVVRNRCEDVYGIEFHLAVAEDTAKLNLVRDVLNSLRTPM